MTPQESKQPFEMLTTFDNLEEMLRWVCFREKLHKDEIRSGLNTLATKNEMQWINEQCAELGYDDWDNFCKETLRHMGAYPVNKGQTQ